MFLSLLAIFVFLHYGQLSVDVNDYLKNSNNNIFRGDMVVCLICVITVIIVERYVNRSDTKSIAQNASLKNDKDKKFFSTTEFFRTST